MNETAKRLNCYLNSLPHKDYAMKINGLAQYLNVNKKIIYNWRKGRTYIHPTWRNLIETYFNEKIF